MRQQCAPDRPGRAGLAGCTLIAAALLAACASRPPAPPPAAERDGPAARAPAGLERVPDAEPRVEPLRSGGPNKPYEVLGQSYTPSTGDRALRETGLASWYGRKFHGLPTASGEPYDMYAMTAAHKTMPIPSYARVRNPANGREVIVRVNDRGPFAAGRVIDLSYTAALKLGVLGGVAPVEVQRLTHDEIRAGTWRREAASLQSPRREAVSLPGSRREAASLPGAQPEAAPLTNSQRTALPPDDPAPGEPVAAVAGPGWWLQLGAFRARETADLLAQRIQREAGVGAVPQVAVLDEDGLSRVQTGPYATRAEALVAGARLRAWLGLAPLLVERRH